MSIAVGTNAHVLGEPMLFYFPAVRRPDCAPQEQRQPLVHAADLHEISRLECVLASTDNPSSELQSIIERGPIRFRQGDDYWLEVGFDNELKNKNADFRPDLPLVLRW